MILVGASLLFSCRNTPATDSGTTTGLDSLYLDHVWAGHPVGFTLLTEPPHQFVAYYDSTRAMVVAHRLLDQRVWDKEVLPEVTGWDSHNYISMALDSKGHLHVSGNMHVDSLVYFQGTAPYDIHRLERRRNLIGDLENRVTYPKFFADPKGDLIFTYRDGGSGNGNQVYNRYNPASGKWSRLLDQPLLDGKGERNAYIHGPILGPDGYYHLIWVWRETPDAETNHDLSYTRSKDLVNWEKSDGSPQILPITLENGEIVAPVPVEQGMINGNTHIGFDVNDQLVISYHRFDENGNTQIYNARKEGGKWVQHKATDWQFRWDFRGRGSLGKKMGLTPVKAENGQLVQEYYIDTAGTRKYLLDPATLAVVQEIPLDKGYPAQLDELRSTFPGMQVNTKVEKTETGEVYLLRWETLTANRDRPREGELPKAQPLMFYSN